MQKSETVSWDLFKFAVKKGNTAEYVAWLLKPLFVRWPEDGTDDCREFSDVGGRLPAGLIPLFGMYLVASSLLDDTAVRKETVAAWVTANGPATEPLTPLPLAQAYLGIWRSVAVVSVHDKVPRITQLLVGAVPGYTGASRLPDWAKNIFDRKAREAIADGLAAAGNTTGRNDPLFVFPLASPAGGISAAEWPLAHLKLHGRSLGLPVALAALSVLRRAPLPGHWLATGDVDPGGQVRTVSSLPIKARGAAREGYALFLYPDADVHRCKTADTLDVRPVTNITVASIWVNCLGPHSREDVQRLETALMSPRDFVNSCAHLQPDLLAYALRECSATCLPENIIANPSFAAELIKKLEWLLTSEAADLKKAEILVAIISPDRLGSLTAISAFKWCSLNMTIANHRGDNKLAEEWKEKAQLFVDGARQADPGEYAGFINRYHVSKLHNRYEFDEKLPEEFARMYDEEKAHHRGGINLVLGAMHGTVARNYAYCGPGFLRRVQELIDASQQCFGINIDPAQAHNWRRGFSVLFGVYMDMGNIKAARENLWRYLDADSWQDYWEKAFAAGGSKSHALYFLVRFLAARAEATGADDDPVSLPPEFTTQVCAAYDETIAGETRHPWQLYSYNMGRLALARNKPELARQAWEKSVALCEAGEETMKVMALLPLSSLRRANMPFAGIADRTMAIIDVIRTSRFLHQNHFKDLLAGQDWQAVLTMVARCPEKYFPFDYR